MRIELLVGLAGLGLVAACSGKPGTSPTGAGGQGGQGGQGGHAGGALNATTATTGDSSGSGGSGGQPDAGPTVHPPPFDWVGIVGTGQSLSVGAAGTPVVSVTQPYQNLKLFDSSPDPKYDGVGDALSLVPLTAPIRPQLAGYPQGPYPNNIAGETIHEGMGNQLSATALTLGGLVYTSVHTVVGESGQSITVIRKNGTGKAYAATLYEAAAIQGLAKAAGKSYGVTAITLTHGETDSADPSYEDEIHQLWADYNADLPPITGQSGVIPLLLTQQGTFPNKAAVRSASTIAEWRLGVDFPGQILCVGPKYQYGYAPDHVHLPALGYRRLGEKYAEVLARATLLGEAWKPLQPSTATLAGATITVAFDVPDPPLAWEESISPPHQVGNVAWAKGRGFEVEDAAGPVAIQGVTLAGASVQIALAAAPAGPGLVVRYAMTQDVDGYTGGTPDARRGQLRDSDPFIGRDEAALDCAAKQGSPALAGAFDERLVGDLVSGPGVAEGTVVLAKPSNAMVTLSQPFTGADGMVKLSFHHDQRNYAVQFELAVK